MGIGGGCLRDAELSPLSLRNSQVVSARFRWRFAGETLGSESVFTALMAVVSKGPTVIGSRSRLRAPVPTSVSIAEIRWNIPRVWFSVIGRINENYSVKVLDDRAETLTNLRPWN